MKIEISTVCLKEDDDDMIEEKEDEDDDKQKLSKRKQKILSRLSVAELKQLVIRPDVVEMHDVTAKDPGNNCLHFNLFRKKNS